MRAAALAALTAVAAAHVQDEPADASAKAAQARGGRSKLLAAGSVRLVGKLTFPGSTDALDFDAFVSEKGGTIRAHILFSQAGLFRILLFDGTAGFERAEDGSYRTVSGADLDDLKEEVSVFALAARFPLDGRWTAADGKPGVLRRDDGVEATLEASGLLRSAALPGGAEHAAAFDAYTAVDHVSFPSAIRFLAKGRPQWTLESAAWQTKVQVVDALFQKPSGEGSIQGFYGSTHDDLPRALQSGVVVLRRWADALEETAPVAAPEPFPAAAELAGFVASHRGPAPAAKNSIFRAELDAQGRVAALLRFTPLAPPGASGAASAPADPGFALSMLIDMPAASADVARAQARIAQAAKNRSLELVGRCLAALPAPAEKVSSRPAAPVRLELIQRVAPK